jgi:hypothetical protein
MSGGKKPNANDLKNPQNVTSVDDKGGLYNPET